MDSKDCVADEKTGPDNAVTDTAIAAVHEDTLIAAMSSASISAVDRVDDEAFPPKRAEIVKQDSDVDALLEDEKANSTLPDFEDALEYVDNEAEKPRNAIDEGSQESIRDGGKCTADKELRNAENCEKTNDVSCCRST